MSKDAKRYRITKCYRRNSESLKVEPYFIIEYLGRRVSLIPPFLGWKWKPLKVERCEWDECYSEVLNFWKLEDAQKTLRNIKEPVYSNEPYQPTT